MPSLAGAVATFPKFKVPSDRVISVREMSNNCIMMFMAAKPLPVKSQEAIDLESYLTSLSRGRRAFDRLRTKGSPPSPSSYRGP